MTKQEEFLYIVQMCTIANSVNLSTLGSETVEKYRHVMSFLGVQQTAQEALRVSKKIPHNLSAADAANEFLIFFLDNQKDSFTDIECPEWCARD